MKLDVNCIRDILLFLEKYDTIQLTNDGNIEATPCWYGEIYKALPAYSKPEIVYTLMRLEEADYISLSSRRGDNSLGDLYVNFITFDGHQFLNTIRNPERWDGIQKGLAAVRDYSISAIGAIAEGMTSAGIAAYLSTKT